MEVIYREICTEADIDQMNWHDCKIYSIQFNPEKFELVFDIDYIFKWVPDQGNFQFFVAPATITFLNVWDIHFDFDFAQQLTINTIEFANPVEPKNIEFVKYKQEWDWRMDLFSGDITFKSAGFIQKNRKKPALLSSQTLEEKERVDLHKYFRTIRQLDGTDDTLGLAIQ